VSSEPRGPSTLLDRPLVQAEDPLLRRLELPHTALYHPHGFPLLVSSNSQAIIDVAEQSFGHFRGVSDAPPVELEVVVAGDADGPAPPFPTIRTRRHMLTLAADAEHFGSCDFEGGFGHLSLSPRILRDPQTLRYLYLETFGFCMICDRHLAPVHASCVALNGSAVLICGPSTAGKSTLAYACARRGFTYVSDDACFLVRSASDRIVSGNCQSLRFRPSASKLFPELSEIPAIRRGNGKLTIEVPARSLGLTTADRCQVDHMVFLNRQPSGPVLLSPMTREQALAELKNSFAYGRDSAIAEQRAAISRLMDLDIRRLTYSDCEPAVDTLEALLLQGETV
jgi:hypothetical protein